MFYKNRMVELETRVDKLEEMVAMLSLKAIEKIIKEIEGRATKPKRKYVKSGKYAKKNK